MDWNAAIERNGQALRRILAMLVAMAGGEAILPRHLHRAILRLLRPAEAAARRLIMVAARGLVVPPPRPRKAKPKKSGSIFVGNGKGTGIVLPSGVRPAALLPGLIAPRKSLRTLALPLLDPLRGPAHNRRPLASVPHISAPGITNPHRGSDRRPLSPYDVIDATRLALRLSAVGRALDDLPAHARRFARWRAARDAAQNRSRDAGLHRRVWPLRPGRPPGSLPTGNRCRPAHEVHEVLADLHSFAFSVLERRDTS